MQIADVAHDGLVETEFRRPDHFENGVAQTTVQRRSRTMSTILPSRANRIIRRVTQIWAETDRAQRRLLEIQTGIPGLTRRERQSRSDPDPRS
jgi:hypothetical protein